ncbi:hypothetical protein D9M70_503630 [compost metagenome]
MSAPFHKKEGAEGFAGGLLSLGDEGCGKQRDEPHDRSYIAGPAADQLDQHIGDDRKRQAERDREGERDQHDREERRDRLISART